MYSSYLILRTIHHGERDDVEHFLSTEHQCRAWPSYWNLNSSGRVSFSVWMTQCDNCGDNDGCCLMAIRLTHNFVNNIPHGQHIYIYLIYYCNSVSMNAHFHAYMFLPQTMLECNSTLQHCISCLFWLYRGEGNNMYSSYYFCRAVQSGGRDDIEHSITANRRC